MGVVCGGRPRAVTPVQKCAIKSAGFRLHGDDKMGVGCRGMPRAVRLCIVFVTATFRAWMCRRRTSVHVQNLNVHQ